MGQLSSTPVLNTPSSASLEVASTDDKDKTPPASRGLMTPRKSKDVHKLLELAAATSQMERDLVTTHEGSHEDGHEISSKVPDDILQRRVEMLESTELFRYVSKAHLESLSTHLHTKVVQKNDVILQQGEKSDRFYILLHGNIKRVRSTQDGKEHAVQFPPLNALTINSMHVISGDPVYATVKCTSDSCSLYEMNREDLVREMQKNPDIATAMIASLCREVRSGTKKFVTPLLDQQGPTEVNVPAVSIAAGIESYYRSALNSILNARLTGVKAELFPNMHVQVPIRVLYINGFKGLRSILSKEIPDPEAYSNPSMVRLATAVAPGIIMTPVSSILEACNAGHKNPEPLVQRWIRGILPRGVREVIFGVGLNQMSDYFEERWTPFVPGKSSVLANAAGSLTAGVVSGYLSHVPHNLSTYKLMDPTKSYKQLFEMFVEKSIPAGIARQLDGLPSPLRYTSRALVATLMPRGVMIRTTQIVGSFIILNGFINFFQMMETRKFQKKLSMSMNTGN
mmetsp:Transcript_20194/g.34820  ORF Transcript_20194/g.34820 Transcript_20194/m.34820 type:complete len:511 (+) Transcript_20194:265-1797(+)|eukprot:CAMPEP_0184693800 /NCGR_PEP_ID=MMETSP0313-20130426/1957_1 /TAXON_ID=2792 /ORGANISM="Porphyridium aerugineum, Strain SAG 1380-2" /LENGTH=510 /DNA_ID=CAMNT_0027151971 /DNA_START=213 /DNA_END=1745 /DNA_ORIENTATION=-